MPTLYVHITEACGEDANRHGLANLLANIQRAVEKTQNLVGFRFYPRYFLAKHSGRNFRLIAYQVPIQDDELILFLRLLPRGDKECEYFVKNVECNIDAVVHRFLPYTHDELRRIHAKLSQERPVPPLPEPSDEERAWLYSVLEQKLTDHDDLFVLETEEWVKKMKAPENQKYLASYHQTLEQMTNLDRLHAAAEKTDYQVYRDSNTRLRIAYIYRPNFKRLILLEPLREGDDENALLDVHRERLAKTGDNSDDLSRITARSYPFYMVADREAWLAIQEDKEANLALSPEEAELLESVHGKGLGGYPLFINGRAGSGKSTMLQYLAMEYVDFALRQDATRRPLYPLYMTSSKELLERARITVRGLLKHNHRNLLERKHDPSKIDAVIDRCFVVFHDFLYSLLPVDRREKFPRDQYVNYAEFLRLWEQDFAKRPEARSISPDVAWHTIRSYIKGMRSSLDNDLGPEDYQLIARDRRSVSGATYRQIYDSVWTRWYQRLCEAENYWDDQDLAAAVIDSDLLRQCDCPAIFCDEAQDFTPIELEIIYQLSLFGRRSRRAEEVARVPIVFAGDPLQTINPTGFRWEAVQAEFHDRFCAVLLRRRAKVQLSYRELHFNYRSNPGIVRFCNLIQLVRAATLGIRDLQPQKAWWVDQSVQPVCFAVEDPMTEQQLKQHEGLVKLVNCEQGGETEYVKGDSILKNLEEQAEGIYRNVLGPTRAKGLEFSDVVLYKFGETAPEKFADLLNGQVDLDVPEIRLPYEYFFNRLYVAASRAKNRLLIVDTRRAIEEFWQFACKPDLVDKLMEKTGDPSRWQNHDTYLVPGNEAAWQGKVDPQEQASEYASQGRLKRDPYLLRQAASAYRNAGNQFEAGKCLAYALELEGKYPDAAAKYRELALNDEAFRCYWTGQKWNSVLELAASEPSFTGRPESRAAYFMAQRPKMPDPTFWSSLVAATKDENWLKETATDASWREVFARLADTFSKQDKNNTIPWIEIHETFRRIRNWGVRLNENQLGIIAFQARDYQEAVSLWEQSKNTDRRDYLEAKAHVDPFPENIVGFFRLKDYREVIRLWREQYTGRPPVHQLDHAIVAAVIDAAIAEGELSLAARLLEAKPDQDRVVKLINASMERKAHPATIAGAVIAARLLVRNRHWTAAIDAAEDARFNPRIEPEATKPAEKAQPEPPRIEPEALRSILQQKGGTTHVFAAVIQELAVSEDLASTRDQKEVREFLYRHFIGRASSRTDRAGISPEVAGAAIERAGKHKDATQFYEDLLRDAPTEAFRKYAAERLVRSLERYADFLQEVQKDEAEAQRRRARARAIREQYGFSEQRQIPEYPVIQQPTVASVTDEEWEQGVFRFTILRQHARLRIEHRPRHEMVTVDGKKRELLMGEATFTELDNSGNDRRWQNADWRTTIGLSDRDGTTVVTVEHPSLTKPVTVNLAP